MEFITVAPQAASRVALLQINRPREKNALNRQLMTELADVLVRLDTDDSTGVAVITGGAEVFAAGADIKEMANSTAAEMVVIDQFETWNRIRSFRKPLIAAVSGVALGGGFELSLMCDMIVASETARFGQPEIKLGTMPGAGGTQRLTRAVGKARAMELILTGKLINAQEALSFGLVNSVWPVDRFLAEALALGQAIAEMSPVALRLAKEAVNQAFEGSLTEGLTVERKNFYLTFTTEDRKEGMSAFIEKRKPAFKGR
jgi:enoyl-CoA hydratase